MERPRIGDKECRSGERRSVALIALPLGEEVD